MPSKRKTKNTGKRPTQKAKTLKRSSPLAHRAIKSELRSTDLTNSLTFLIMEMALGFLTGAVAVLVIQITITREVNQYYASLQQTLPNQIVTTGQEEQVPSQEPGVECLTDQDCISPIEICSAAQTCVPLLSPVGICSQPTVLTYTERSTGRSKHTFCDRGCTTSPQGARCL